ncbi:hypothetical protein [Shewanella cutis]|uniref:Uncharacterized protein n=1 Tax=Shewanella cutis TaxID=2766780 RepID=A0ABS9QW90_9GAMM|nr:hypothetical protein [Shewanella sp. PS-2]MCG9964596.1 hypothetical protein [Shewanella sp. PS-2]
MLVDVVANNVADLLIKHGIRAADLARMSEEAGLDINKTFMSRLFNIKHDFLLSKVDSLIIVIKRLEPSFNDHEIFIPNFFQGESAVSQKLTQDDLNDLFKEILFDLIDMNWLDVKQDVPAQVVSDFMTSSVKKNFPNLLSDTKEKAAV